MPEIPIPFLVAFLAHYSPPLPGREIELWIMVLTAWLLCMTAAYLWHLRILRKSREKYQRQLSRDLHDELGGKMSVLMMYSELALHADNSVERQAYLQKVRAAGIQIHRSLRDIITDRNHHSSEVGPLLEELGESASEMTNGSSPEFFLHPSPKEVRKVKLQAGASRQVSLLFREAIHNAVRHSQASRIDLRAALDDDHLIITLRDDGCGFDTLQNNLGHGLGNMSYRAKKLGGRLVLQSPESGGTLVSLVLSLHTVAVGQ